MYFLDDSYASIEKIVRKFIDCDCVARSTAYEFESAYFLKNIFELLIDVFVYFDHFAFNLAFLVLRYVL